MKSDEGGRAGLCIGGQRGSFCSMGQKGERRGGLGSFWGQKV